MRYYLLLCLLTSGPLYAQTVSGVVLDQVSETPIAYAVISFPGTPRGIYSDTDGQFNIEASSPDSLEISSLGYQTQKVIIPKSGKLTIHLKQVSYEISPVQVTKRSGKAKKKKVGKVKKSGHVGISVGQGAILARYLENKDGNSGYLASLNFGLLPSSAYDCSGLIRVRIFEALTEGDSIMPGKDVLLDSPIVTIGPKRSRYEVDATDWEIELPPAGLLIGLEFLGESPGCPNFNPEGHGKSLSFVFNDKLSNTWMRVFNGTWAPFGGRMEGKRTNINIMVAAEYRVFKD